MAANTSKVSVTMGREALHLAQAMAERTGHSLSSLVTAAVERGLPEVIQDLARLRAADALIAEMPASTKPSAAEVRAFGEMLDLGRIPNPDAIEKAFPRASDPPRAVRTRGRANKR